MSDIKILEEKPLSLVEIKEILSKEKKGELSERAKRTLDYINATLQIKEKKITELEKILKDLKISRLKEKQIKKLIDILPQDIDSLRSIFTAETISLKDEDMQKILETIKQNTT
jgi:DNA-directed RNA polymerase subunit F